MRSLLFRASFFLHFTKPLVGTFIVRGCHHLPCPQYQLSINVSILAQTCNMGWEIKHCELDFVKGKKTGHAEIHACHSNEVAKTPMQVCSLCTQTFQERSLNVTYCVHTNLATKNQLSGDLCCFITLPF